MIFSGIIHDQINVMTFKVYIMTFESLIVEGSAVLEAASFLWERSDLIILMPMRGKFQDSKRQTCQRISSALFSTNTPVYLYVVLFPRAFSHTLSLIQEPESYIRTHVF